MRAALMLGLATVLLGLVMIQLFVERADQTPALPSQDNAMTAYARDLSVVTTDTTGAESWQVSAPAARYYEATDEWQMDAPQWRWQTDNAPPWRGSADRSIAYDRQQTARLEGSVELLRNTEQGQTHLTTEYLDVDLARHYATTDAPVRLTAPNYDIASSGARAWFDEGRIELLNAPRGRYEPANQ